MVIPIRSFHDAKARLAEALDAPTRAARARQLADRVLSAATPMPVVVVSSAPEVKEWADARGATVLEDPGSLDAAAEIGRSALHGLGCTRVVIAHGDLPRARTFTVVARDADAPIAVLVPCHRDDGTNVLSLPADVPFDFSYGSGSYRRHLAEARRRGLATRVVRDPDLRIDIDAPDDLAYLEELPAGAVAPA